MAIDFLSLVEKIGAVGLWLSAVGIIFILWLIFQSVTLFMNMKRIREISTIKDDMKRMDKKLNKILKKK